ncbi:MAG: hypothetical protein ACI9T9_001938 [Oleiphilaceae bacterium]|jgi:hypothetical protein
MSASRPESFNKSFMQPNQSKSAMSRHIKGQSRTQTTLFPKAIDDFVTEDNPIRVIDLSVDQVDLLELGF